MGELRAQAGAEVGVGGGAGRLLSLDATRGFALLGITFVNMAIFCQPTPYFLEPSMAGELSWIDEVSKFLVGTFCASKFFTLFSLMFGIGMVMIMRKVERMDPKPTGGFVLTFLRRLAVLGTLGLLHAILVWNGDILFIYAVCGLVLLATARAKPSTHVVIGAIALFIGLMLGLGLTVLGMFGGEGASKLPSQLPTELAQMSPVARYFNGFGYGQGEYSMAAWASAELQAYRDGPWIDALSLRAAGWVMMLFFVALSMGWTVIAMFMFGAALIKLEIFDQRGAKLRGRLMWIGFGVGVPVAIVGQLAFTFSDSMLARAAYLVCATVSGPMLAVGWLCAMPWLVRRSWFVGMAKIFAKVGKMGLTNYLLMSVLATGVTYHWGLGYFGSIQAGGQILLTVGLYGVIVVWTLVWARVSSVGPLEWFWKVCTYGRRGERYSLGK